MNSVNWQQIKKIFYSALEHMPAEREVFLDEACASDADLRRDVEILLDSYQSEFLEKPAVGKFDPAVIVEPQTVKIGTQINQYKIIQKLGTGGMGEVFLAEDTRLNRQVAIKFFQSASVFGAQSEHRLLREAQSAARLNHPNICTIYEIAESENGSFIVMEYIEGETLEERIQREKPTDSEIIQLVLSIADALADAHSHGIVHRDIKPSNVMLNTRGQVKVLDFSLAKKTFTENSENKASFLSESGVIAGTIAYMSPEQARGQNIDTRSDIWSLGVVLYEMLAGCQPFEGETKSDLIAAILLSEPALLRNFLTNPPAEAEQIIRRALEKNVELRYQSIEDFSNDLRRLQVIFGVSEKTLGFTALTAENATAKLSEARSAEAVNFIEITDSTVMPKTGEEKIYSIGKYSAENTRSRKFSVLLLLTVLLLGGVAFWKFGLRSTATSFFFTPELRANLKISTLFDIKRKQGSFITGLNFSPDGNLLAFSSTAEGKGSIFVKQIESEEAIKITDGKWFDNSPVWSSDGQRLAFVSNRSGNFAIWTISYLGGNPLPLPKSEVTPDTALKKWSTDGRTIYYESSGNFYALDVANGEAAKINPAIQSAIGNFNISADEKMIAYVAMENEKEQIWIQSLQDGKTKQIAAGNYHHWSPVWFPDNEHLAYCTDQNGNFQLYVSDKNQGETNQITFGDSDVEAPVVSPDGRKIAFLLAKDEANVYSFDLSRRLETPITEKTGIQIFPTVSPSGEQLIFESITTETKVHNGLLKIESLSDTGNGVKLSGDAAFPRWSPDGKKIAFIRKSNYTPDIWMMSVNGQDETQLTKGGILERGWFQVPFNTLGNFYDWSPDGQSLAYAAKRNGFYNILTIGTGGASEIARTQNTDQKLLIYSPFFSPDGKRLVYLSENTVEKGENRFSVEIAESGNTKTVFTGGPAVQLCGWKNAPESSAFVAVKKGEEVDLYKISTDSGKQPKAIARLAAANLYSVKISPDGKQFVFTARRDGSDNIFLGAEDKEPVQLTANIDPYIFYAGLEWSPDGKKLFYSRQTGGRQISMITNSK